jgi:hypothetical protein
MVMISPVVVVPAVTFARVAKPPIVPIKGATVARVVIVIIVSKTSIGVGERSRDIIVSENGKRA